MNKRKFSSPQPTQILNNGKYLLDMELKSPDDHRKWSDSYHIAKRRFQNNPSLSDNYKQFIKEYISLVHTKYVLVHLKNEKEENKYYIPHLCVTREESKTTKLRVVF